MKKKLTSALALAMAMALTFGMTVCAAGSSSTTTVTPNVDVKSESVAADTTDPANANEKATLEGEAAAFANGITVDGGTATPLTAGELKDVRAKAGDIALKAVSKNAVIVVKAGADIEGPTGVDLTIKIPGFVKEAGKKYMVLHLDEAKKVWETIDAEIKDGEITANFASLSPVVLVEISEKAGGGSAPAGATTEASPAESPKTGEVLPVAGIMAVICLAGAAVSAKKVRFSK